MWGIENWGEMIWGGPPPVPLLEPLGLVVLTVGLLAAGHIVLSRRHSPWLAHLMWMVLLVTPMASYGALISMPNTFVSGTVADASQVNANFDTLVVESNDQDARLSGLEEIEKSIKIPASALALNFGATSYGFDGIDFAPGFNNSVAATVPMPKDWNGTSNFVVKVLFRTSSSESAVVSFFVRVTGRIAGEVLNDPGPTTAAGVPVSTFLVLHSQSFVVPASRFSPSDDVIHIYAIQRGGTGETSTNSVALLAVEISYF